MRLGIDMTMLGRLRSLTVPSTLLDGLVSYWPLDETSGTRVDAVGSNDLTDNNTVGYDTGVSGNAASFVAANGESLTNDTFTLDGNTEFSISLWQGYWGGANRTFGIGDDASGRFVVDDAAGTWYVFNTIGGSVTLSAATVPADAWRHILLTFTDSDRKLRAYVNNELAGTSDALAGTPNFAADRIGVNAQFAFGAWSFQSTIKQDEVAIWNRVLTEDERTALYAAGAGYFYPFA